MRNSAMRTESRLPIIITCALAVVAGLFTTGCTPQDRYDHLLTANRSLKEQVASMQHERDEARAELRAVQDRLVTTTTSYDTLQVRYDELNSSVEGLDEANEDYLRRIARLEMGPLPIEVETAIEDLAVAHPDVLAFDAKMGMVRFASDFTFDLGSVSLKDDANRMINELATILNEPAARGLEARVVGHTDNVPIRRPETKRRHPTNKHLSVHRAISVGDALIAAGVDPTRIQVAGYGEFRPVVVNGKRGAAANRRVEIFLFPMPNTDLEPWGEPGIDSATDRAATVDPSK
jgi:flagellar motor protein MotB